MAKINHIGITVKDMEKSIEFYKLLGLKLLYVERRDSQRATKALFEAENIHLELWKFDDEKPSVEADLHSPGVVHVAFEVQDIKKTRSLLISQGYEVDEIKFSPSKRYYCFVKGPDGVVVELYM